MLKTGTDFNSSLLRAGTTDAKPMLLSLPVIVESGGAGLLRASSLTSVPS